MYTTRPRCDCSKTTIKMTWQVGMSAYYAIHAEFWATGALRDRGGRIQKGGGGGGARRTNSIPLYKQSKKYFQYRDGYPPPPLLIKILNSRKLISDGNFIFKWPVSCAEASSHSRITVQTYCEASWEVNTNDDIVMRIPFRHSQQHRCTPATLCCYRACTLFEIKFLEYPGRAPQVDICQIYMAFSGASVLYSGHHWSLLTFPPRHTALARLTTALQRDFQHSAVSIGKQETPNTATASRPAARRMRRVTVDTPWSPF